MHNRNRNRYLDLYKQKAIKHIFQSNAFFCGCKKNFLESRRGKDEGWKNFCQKIDKKPF